jgi:amylovoran biosynthesis glycosyltransferase AmsE
MTVSVLMSVYEKDDPILFRGALESLLFQTSPISQLVLIEDGKLTEELSNIIEDFRERLPIDSVVLPANLGLAGALNSGLVECRHEIVARMDSDDVSHPERIEKQFYFMRNNPEISVLSCSIREKYLGSTGTAVRKLPKSHPEILKFAKFRSPINHPAAMFRKSAVLAVGGYPNYRKAQDSALWSLLIVSGYRFANLEEELLTMNIPSNFAEKRGLDHLKAEIEILKYQRKIGFISNVIFFRNIAIRIVLRLSPSFLKRLTYLASRKLFN